MIDTALFIKSIPALAQGAIVSLKIASVACAIGFTLGTLLGIARTTASRITRLLIDGYVYVLRGTPMLVQIFFLFYILPELGIRISAFWSATLAIGLNSAAYISEIVRSGINAIPKGQIEAAHVLGLNSWQTKRYILMPQLFRVILPSLGNELVTLVKDSSLASIIGVMELTKEGSIIRSRTYDAFTILLATALIYLFITSTLSFMLRKLEKRVSSHA